MKLLFWRKEKKQIQVEEAKVAEDLYQEVLKKNDRLIEEKQTLIHEGALLSEKIAQLEVEKKEMADDNRKIRRDQTEADLLLATLRIAFKIISGKSVKEILLSLAHL